MKEKLRDLKVETLDLIIKRDKLEIEIKKLNNFILENLADIAELKIKLKEED